MKIAFFSKQLPSDAPNGVSIQVHRLANALVQKEHAVTCFTFSPAPADALYKVEELPWGTSSRLWRKFSPAARFAAVETSGFDIVHYHGDDYCCPGSSRRVRTFYGSALFEAVHAGRPLRCLYQSFFYAFEWISCMKKGTLVAISTVTQRALPLVRRRVPCGVPLNRFYPSGPKTDHPSILFLGDMRGRKRGELLCNLFERSLRYRVPGCSLTVIGPSAPALTGGTTFLGRVDEARLIDELRRSWVICIPSSYEGFGVPVIEAMACGTVVVAAANSGLGEMIVSGTNGYLSADRDLESALFAVLTDAPLRERLAAAGLSCAKDYDIDVVADAYGNLYQSIHAGASPV